MEKWTPIYGFESTHKINENGQIKSNARNKILNYQVSKNGYFRVVLWNVKKFKNCTVHRLMALTFLPNTYNKPTVNHKDGNKLNNKIDNIEWATWSENSRHAIALFNLKPVNIGMINSTNPKQVYQIDKITDNIINEYLSCADAARELGLSYNSCTQIAYVARGGEKSKTAFGFKWKYKTINY